MKILVACEESQAVTIELRKLGHEAYSCDIEPCSGGHPEWHLQVDALELLKIRWDMIIAFPPCTYLSNAGACRLYPKKGQLNQERYEKGLEAKSFFLRFLNADCPKIAVENPVSSTVFQMPPHSQEIQPWQFGHPYTGKHDMSGAEVYEGDVIENPDGIRMEIKYGLYDAYCPADRCNMDSIGFYAVGTGLPEMPIGPLEDYAKVIGNIYENPDLLNPQN